ncbi:hypothetical protein CFP56_021685 [Quercus suber]|uniref:Uncharacterized protein n=1 Tax=Quercus suber TaxID=58331 RepID=A0AAW0KCN5_QUESU
MPPTWNWKEFATARLFSSKNRLSKGELKSSKGLVKWKDITGDSGEEFGGYIGNRYNRIASTVGYVLGLKVDAVSLRKSESLQVVLDKFVKHIRDYTATVLASSNPAGIIMFGEGPVDLKPFIDVLGIGWLPLVCERFILLPVTWGRAISGKFML